MTDLLNTVERTGRRKGPARSRILCHLVCGMGLIVAMSLVTNAHEVAITAAQTAPRKVSLLEKIQRFQRTVKGKIDRAICPGCVASSPQHSHDASPVMVQQTFPTEHIDTGDRMPIVQRSRRGSTRPLEGAESHAVDSRSTVPTERMSQHRIAPVQSTSPPSTRTQMDIDYADFRELMSQQQPNSPQDYSNMPMDGASIPPPITNEIPNASSSPVQDGFPQPPVRDSSTQQILVGGTHLGGMRVTATEQALRLKAENEALTDSRKTLLQDNQRLRSQLQSALDQLSRSKRAIDDAEQQLKAAESQNAKLRSDIVDLKREQQRQLRETDSILTSIRNELDDVLVREINAANQ